jgi:hypothetical protein
MTQRLVPAEPTDEMYTAGWQRANKGDCINKSGAITDTACLNIYRAMLAAAPKTEILQQAQAAVCEAYCLTSRPHGWLCRQLKELCGNAKLTTEPK